MRALNRGFEIETRPVVAKRPPAGACNCEETNDANFYFYSCVVMVSDGVSFAFAQQPRYVVSPFAPFFNYGSRSSGPIPRTVVDFQSSYAPGTIFIDTTERRLYLVTGRSQAIRYGIGVGRDGFGWAGALRVS